MFIGALLPFSACREAGPDLPEADARYVDVTVTLGREDEAEDGTRSIVDFEVENFQKAALFAFDAKTGAGGTRRRLSPAEELQLVPAHRHRHGHLRHRQLRRT